MLVDADLHIHGAYSTAVSGDMTIENIATNARKKGLHVVGTGDCLHPKWLEQLKALKEVAKGTYEHGCGTRFVLTTEIEDRDRVHHLIFLPSLEAAEDLRMRLQSFSIDMNTNGRPAVRIDAEALGNIILDLDGMIGPSHAFTPWTSLYKSFHSLRQCYKGITDKIKFLELGLSADTYFADRISELKNLTFLSNSDAHSPAPHRLGREFNRFEVQEATYGEIALAIRREGGRKPVLNVGLDPREGKYHCTACSKCFHKYSMKEAIGYKFKCILCAGRIKKGVKDRIDELADQPSTSPEHRPQYLHIFPLSEIIKKSVKGQAEAQEIWDKLVERFGSEIKVLTDAGVEGIAEVNPAVASSIKKFREGETILIPGGGGKYGELIIPKDREELKEIIKKRSSEINCVSGIAQKTLDQFVG